MPKPFQRKLSKMMVEKRKLSKKMITMKNSLDEVDRILATMGKKKKR